MIKPKVLKDFLEEDKSLTTPLTYEEFNSAQSGFDDIGIEETYETYKRVLESQNTAQ